MLAASQKIENARIAMSAAIATAIISPHPNLKPSPTVNENGVKTGSGITASSGGARRSTTGSGSLGACICVGSSIYQPIILDVECAAGRLLSGRRRES
jgi:hypothetical protein